MNMQEYADPNSWSETDAILASLAHRSAGKLGLQLRPSRLQTMDWQAPLPHFKDSGTLEMMRWLTHSDNHALASHFDSPEPFRGYYASDNAYWKTVDTVHRRIEADATFRKLEGSKNRTTDGSSLAEKIRRRHAKKKRDTTRPV